MFTREPYGGVLSIPVLQPGCIPQGETQVGVGRQANASAWNIWFDGKNPTGVWLWISLLGPGGVHLLRSQELQEALDAVVFEPQRHIGLGQARAPVPTRAPATQFMFRMLQLVFAFLSSEWL